MYHASVTDNFDIKYQFFFFGLKIEKTPFNIYTASNVVVVVTYKNDFRYDCAMHFGVSGYKPLL